MQKFTRNHSIPPLSDYHLSLWLQEAPIHQHMSPSSEILSSGELPADNAQSHRKTKTIHGENEGSSTLGGCKRQKRALSTQVHNMNERLRRKKLTDKMTKLQEMLPNSMKKDQASTIDDAIKYIKTLQCLVQMMSVEASHTLFQQGLIPCPVPVPVPVLQTESGSGSGSGSGGNGMWLPFVPNPNPWLLGLTPHQNNPAQFSLESVYANTNIPILESQSSNGEPTPTMSQAANSSIQSDLTCIHEFGINL